MSAIRTRIAPSPTGLFHIGTARTALFNYLFAKRNGGKFILRIEDTDRERSRPEFEKDILDGLQWLGISYDEGPIRQSERTAIYTKYLKRLLDEEKAGWCDAPQTEGISSEAHRCEKHGGFNKEGRGIIRFNNKAAGSVRFSDRVRGDVEFPIQTLGNFSIAKNLEFPLYNFAVVVDDELMNISHVIRGEDHISNTPKQLLLIEALGFKRPEYAHIPLILGPDRSKLSKRHGATSLSEYKARGYLPEALVNFMALLGWNPGDEREIFSRAELEHEFDLKKVQKSGAIFNQEKLDWFNAHYIKQKSVDELVTLCIPYLHSAFGIQHSEFLKKVVALEQPRLKKLSDIVEQTRFFFELPEYDAALLSWKGASQEKIAEALTRSKNILARMEKLPASSDLQDVFYREAEKVGGKGEFLWPLRVALSGQKHSPGPFEIIQVLGIEKSIMRIDGALTKLK